MTAGTTQAAMAVAAIVTYNGPPAFVLPSLPGPE